MTKNPTSSKHSASTAESDDIVAERMGLEGVVELQKFVEAGGLMITLGTASSFPADFGITRKVEAARTTAAFYAPGPIVEAEIMRPVHPVFYGYTDKTQPVRWANGPLLTVPLADREQQVLMRFPGGDLSDGYSAACSERAPMKSAAVPRFSMFRLVKGKF